MAGEPEKAPPLEDTVAGKLTSKGDLYRTPGGRLYFHLKRAKGGEWDEVFALDETNQRLKTLAAEHGINPASPAFGKLVALLCAKADGHGFGAEIYQVTHQDKGVVYVDQGWGGNRPVGRMWRVSGSGIQDIGHGVDGIVFLPHPRDGFLQVEGVECGPACAAGVHLRLPKLLSSLGLPAFGESVLTPEQALQALQVSIYNLYLDAPTNPILVLLGERNSGKTWLAKMIQYLYTGSLETMGADGNYKDVSAALTNRRLAVMDNFDEAKKALLDLFARVATGGEESRRELYTTNSQVTFPFTARLLITQRNPTLTRDDLAERLVILRCSEQTRIIPEAELISRLVRLAPLVRGAILHDLKHILHEYERGAEGWHTNFRMADYALLGHYVARAQGTAEEWDRTLYGLRGEQLEYLGMGSPLTRVLKDFLLAGDYEGTAGSLYEALGDVGLPKSIGTPEMLASELWRLRDVLERHGMILFREMDKSKKQYMYALSFKVAASDVISRPAPWATAVLEGDPSRHVIGS